MADRTSAGLFADIFTHLAGMDGSVLTPPTAVTGRDREFALWLWNKIKDYDFRPYQMGCEEALQRLGLARLTPDTTPMFVTRGPDEHEKRVQAGTPYWVYGPEGEQQ